MQSVVSYGRFLFRAVVNEIGNEFLSSHWLSSNRLITSLKRRTFHLISALSGLSKTHSGPPLSPSFSPSFSQINQRSFGDDSCFAVQNNAADVLGVADGVGGWRTYGVDPSQFSRSLMAICERLVKLGKFSAKKPIELLNNSYEEMQLEKTSLIGSCTACIVALNREDKKIYTANLGDSGFLVIRDGRIIHKSEEQTHYFNTPFQLALAPTMVPGAFISDSPDSAQSTTFSVEEGDLILIATDGLFDNLNDQVILKHLSNLKAGSSLADLQKVANEIANEAHKCGFNPSHRSPFSINAANNGFNVIGGKPDDVTVLLAQVACAGSSTDNSIDRNVLGQCNDNYNSSGDGRPHPPPLHHHHHHGNKNNVPL
ncbi:hypothetical protein HELRODRAFT_99567 [Helobdella robusta]|uniref:Protein phosphatase n=1 Tax=Helobdella robusta TaxID=6412 RepID=T1G9T7_HELRO|nr:hypothetical protein HELRODRAFT_99567 [Helobdella robusta]ESO04675.1 hypothetical protein HELRODRAFT_99567 [Helobdella robusta]